MKRIPLGVAAATPCLFETWCSAICLAAFLTTISASAAADAQTSAEGLSPAEQWVVAQATTGETADLSKQFPEEEDRQLSADFLETLLMGTRPDVKLHRHGVLIKGACIDEPIDLENAQIPCDVVLEHCQFNAGTDFSASFAGSISFENSAFKAIAIFYAMKVGGNASFENAVFEAPVHFDSANIARAFHAEGTKFQDKEEGATFTSIKVGQAFFIDAVFEGPVTFVKADIDGIFGAVNAKFRNKKGGTAFIAMKVGGNASFENAVFEAPVSFNFSEFVTLDLSNVSWPDVYMQGMSYKYIRAAPEELDSHKALLKLANQSAYSAEVYSKLEEFFLRQGYRGDADKVFIAGKRRERKEYFYSAFGSSFGTSVGYWFRWLGSWMLYLLVGYGRRPWQAGIACAVVIALGCVLFSPNKMEPQTPRVYSRFWYSLNLFLPVVDLQAGKVWKPKADQTFLRNYMRVHILLGWILIPLVVAALTGLIK
jgi:uncharacterized protein YjbI with pentapeptide repeats